MKLKHLLLFFPILLLALSSYAADPAIWTASSAPEDPCPWECLTLKPTRISHSGGGTLTVNNFGGPAFCHQLDCGKVHFTSEVNVRTVGTVNSIFIDLSGTVVTPWTLGPEPLWKVVVLSPSLGLETECYVQRVPGSSKLELSMTKLVATAWPVAADISIRLVGWLPVA